MTEYNVKRLIRNAVEVSKAVNHLTSFYSVEGGYARVSLKSLRMLEAAIEHLDWAVRQLEEEQ